MNDSVHVNIVNMTDIHTYQRGEGELYKVTESKRSEEMLHHVTAKANKRGMLVTSKKTGLLCISAATSYSAGAQIRALNGELIDSTDTMKVLGFTFNTKGNVDSHIEQINSDRECGLLEA